MIAAYSYWINLAIPIPEWATSPMLVGTSAGNRLTSFGALSFGVRPLSTYVSLLFTTGFSDHTAILILFKWSKIPFQTKSGSIFKISLRIITSNYFSIVGITESKIAKTNNTEITIFHTIFFHTFARIAASDDRALRREQFKGVVFGIAIAEVFNIQAILHVRVRIAASGAGCVWVFGFLFALIIFNIGIIQDFGITVIVTITAVFADIDTFCGVLIRLG